MASRRGRGRLAAIAVVVCGGVAVDMAWSDFAVRSFGSSSPELFGHFGWSVANAGDATGDGVPDLVVGAVNEDGVTINDGKAYLFDGVDGKLVMPLTSPLAEINGGFGIAVAGVGDVDGDGRADLAIGAWREDEPGAFTAGHVHVLSGVDGRRLRTLASPNVEEAGVFGGAIAAVGDANGDGFIDLVVGAVNEDGGAVDSGRAYLFSGADGGLLQSLQSPNPEPGGGFGNAVAGAGDVNGDGGDDIVVGAISEGAGHAYVFDGSDGSLLYALSSPDPHGFFGNAVAGAGDVDGDGRAEVLVGAYRELDGFIEAGRAHVFSGADGALVRTLTSPAPEASGLFGGFVAGVGDVDGNGVADWLVGARNEDGVSTGGGLTDAGRAYLFSGFDGALLSTLSSPTPKEFGLFGFSGGGAGDVDRDGRADLIIGTFFEDGTGSGDGSVHLFATNSDAPSLILSGTCPGDVTARLAGLTPNGPVAVLAAESAGEVILPVGPCAGTAVDLASPRLLRTLRAGAEGTLAATRSIADPAVCGLLLQALDRTTCEVSNVAGPSGSDR